MKLTAAAVRRRVAALRKLAHMPRQFRDAEALHGDEDSIHQSVLRAIAEGSAGWEGEMAREALKTLAVEFPRHTA